MQIHKLAYNAKGFFVAFVDGQVLMWPRGKTIDDSTIIGEQEGGLYKLKGQREQAFDNDSIKPSELWHRRLAHVHYRALPITSKVVSRLLKIQAKHEGTCKGCAQGKNVKKPFPRSEIKENEILETIHSDVCIPMSFNSLSEYAYYVSFIDDYSHKCWIIS